MQDGNYAHSAYHIQAALLYKDAHTETSNIYNLRLFTNYNYN